MVRFDIWLGLAAGEGADKLQILFIGFSYRRRRLQDRHSQ